MKICLDVRYRTESGASSYIKNVVPHLLREAPQHRWYLLKYAEQRFDFEDAFEAVVSPPGRADLLHLLWTSLILPRFVRRHGIDVYHAMKMPGPSWTGARTVTTMHSIFDAYQGTFPVDLRTRLFLTFYGNPMVRRSDRVIAVSGFIRDCLVEQYLSADRVDVAYNGIDARFGVRPEQEVAAYRSRHDLPERYVLCVGNVTPVKNHVTAVRAFAEAALPAEVPLVLAGDTKNAYAKQVLAEAERLGVATRMRLLGFVAPDDLPLLMNGATLLLFPSLTEGCPVTMLEAFGCGLPILASRRGGLWDLGKDVAWFVDDPHDHACFARRLATLWSDGEALRAGSSRAREAARAYTWERSAAAHLGCYEKLEKRP